MDRRSMDVGRKTKGLIIWPSDAEEELKQVEMEYIWTYQPRNRVSNKLLVGVAWAFVIEVVVGLAVIGGLWLLGVI